MLINGALGNCFHPNAKRVTCDVIALQHKRGSFMARGMYKLYKVSFSLSF